MPNSKSSIFITLIAFVFISCEEKKKDNTAASAVEYLLRPSVVCASSSTTTISNSELGTTPAMATQYNISGCDSNSLFSLGFSSQNITTGITGTSAESKIAANGDLFSSNDVNIEVTFSLNNASGYLEVIGQGSGSAATIDGPAIRINPATIQARGTAGSGGTLLDLTNQSTSVGQTFTYCLEFHNETSDLHAIFWSSACTSVSAIERGTYTKEVEVTSTFPGKRIGFILNNVTLQSFTVRTKIGTAVNLLEP